MGPKACVYISEGIPVYGQCKMCVELAEGDMRAVGQEQSPKKVLLHVDIC